MAYTATLTFRRAATPPFRHQRPAITDHVRQLSPRNRRLFVSMLAELHWREQETGFPEDIARLKPTTKRNLHAVWIALFIEAVERQVLTGVSLLDALLDRAYPRIANPEAP